MAELRIKRFFGINTKVSDIDIAVGESYGQENFNLTQDGLEQRYGTTLISSNVFEDSLANPVPITGLYSNRINGTIRQVGTGGNRFQEYTGGGWVDRTGAAIITSSQNNLFRFERFFDNGANQVYIMVNGVDAPLKWDGGAAAAVLAGVPGNFSKVLVHKNKLWGVVDDFIYFSAQFDGETYNIVRDVVRFSGNGGDILDIVSFQDRIVVIQPKAISVISGQDYRDLYVEEVVTGEGGSSGFSAQVINSRRYGSIVMYLADDGTFKGFNGSPTPLKLGEPAENTLFNGMNRSRRIYATGVDYEERSQYVLAISSGSNLTNDQLILYDYFNDVYSHPESGRPISTILNHTGTAAQVNAAAIFEYDGKNRLVTGDYDGNLVLQDVPSALRDHDNSPITSTFLSGKNEFGTPTHIKLITDCNVLTTQYSRTTLNLVLLTQIRRGETTKEIDVDAGSRWGTMIWGVGRWADSSPVYTRMDNITLDDSTDEGGVYGRYIQFQLNHTEPDERLKLEELIISTTDLGEQQEYLET